MMKSLKILFFFLLISQAAFSQAVITLGKVDTTANRPTVAGQYRLGMLISGGDTTVVAIPKSGNVVKLLTTRFAVVDWDAVINKPSTFPPSTHTHPISQVTNLQASLNDKVSKSVADTITAEKLFTEPIYLNETFVTDAVINSPYGYTIQGNGSNVRLLSGNSGIAASENALDIYGDKINIFSNTGNKDVEISADTLKINGSATFNKPVFVPNAILGVQAVNKTQLDSLGALIVTPGIGDIPGLQDSLNKHTDTLEVHRNQLATKVDKVSGLQLSQESYTTTEKGKLAGIAAGAEVNVNADWNSVSGDSQILNKPSTFAPLPWVQDSLSKHTDSLERHRDQIRLKVDKVAGKGLSTEDYSTAEKSKLAGIASGATANSTDVFLLARANHTGVQAISTVSGLQTALDAKIPTDSLANFLHKTLNETKTGVLTLTQSLITPGVSSSGSVTTIGNTNASGDILVSSSGGTAPTVTLRTVSTNRWKMFSGGGIVHDPTGTNTATNAGYGYQGWGTFRNEGVATFGSTVGIGTTSPNTSLEVFNSSSLSAIRINNGSSTAAAGNSQLQLFAGSSPAAANAKNFSLLNVNGAAAGQNLFQLQARNDDGSFKGILLSINQGNGNTTLSGTLFPDVTNSRDLGSSSLTWNNAYVGNVFTNNIAINANANLNFKRLDATVMAAMFPSSGRWAFQTGGTYTDDNVNLLQVGGSIKATQFRMSALSTAPSSATDTGTLGEIRITSGFIYVCTATNVWVRTALSSW